MNRYKITNMTHEEVQEAFNTLKHNINFIIEVIGTDSRGKTFMIIQKRGIYVNEETVYID